MPRSEELAISWPFPGDNSLQSAPCCLSVVYLCSLGQEAYLKPKDMEMGTGLFRRGRVCVWVGGGR